MKEKIHLPFFTLLLMISFAAVNAVLFTPALPEIARFFSVSDNMAQQTVSWFLIGYALGQLIYGPIANRYGRKKALYVGILLQIISSLVCVLAGWLHAFSLLTIARFFIALGSGVGLNITFTLVNETYETKIASQKISYLILAFAVTPGLSVALGGILVVTFGWMSCFYAGALYGVILLLLVSRLPETLKQVDMNAFHLKHLLNRYLIQFKNPKLVSSGLLMSSATSFVYVFASVAPFLAISHFGMGSEEYGFANLIPSAGLILSSILNGYFVKKSSLFSLLKVGILFSAIGVVLMFIAISLKLSAWLILFIPVFFISLGICFSEANASTIGMTNIEDKAHASAVMNFLNMGFTTLIVLGLGFFNVTVWVLLCVYVGVLLIMMLMYRWLRSTT